jgi:hypothetical protein
LRFATANVPQTFAFVTFAVTVIAKGIAGRPPALSTLARKFNTRLNARPSVYRVNERTPVKVVLEDRQLLKTRVGGRSSNALSLAGLRPF